jgi:hypothetical protein
MQINKLRTELLKITTYTNKTKKIIREYFKNLYSNNLENLEETDQFLDVYELPKLNIEDINHINRLIASNEIEAVIVYQQSKVQNWTDSLLNSTRP